MLTKLVLIFIVGIIENFLYTWYLLEVGRKRPIKSSILNFVYFSIYLCIVAWAMKDIDTVPVLITYALACSIGNYLQIICDIRLEIERKKMKQKERAKQLTLDIEDQVGPEGYGAA